MTTVHEHKPVFLDAVMNVFRGVQIPVQAAFDGTFGRGGHARAVMNEWPGSKMIALDCDQSALDFATENFSSEISGKRLNVIRANYTEFVELQKSLASSGWPSTFDLMLLDLGVSSPQLDQAERGFSFYHDGPLDMRMDHRNPLTAAEIVNSYDEQDLARLFIEYGEVQRPFRVVRAIVNDRKAKKPFTTTKELAGLIERVDGWQKKGSHPATRYFMALRLKVNDELDGLENVLPNLINGLNEGGILAVITFHSLEDRIVKNVFKDHLHLGKLINKKVIKPTDEEVRDNPRSRSAKLRAFEKGTHHDEN